MFITIKLDSNNKSPVTEKGNSRCSCKVRIEQPKGNIYSPFSVFKNITSFILHSFFSLQQNKVDLKAEKAKAALVTCLTPHALVLGHASVMCWGQPAMQTPAHQHQGLLLLNLHLQKQLHYAKCPLRKSGELGSPTETLGPCRIAGGKQQIESKKLHGLGRVNKAGEITSACWGEQNQVENEHSHAHQGCTESRAVNSCGCHLLE